jgi:hypothetical protein
VFVNGDSLHDSKPVLDALAVGRIEERKDRLLGLDARGSRRSAR